MISIDVVASAGCVNEKALTGSVPVVIDVLRATSVMVTAFEHGIKKIIPVLTPGEAFEMKKTLTTEAVLLGGERDAELIPGFDLDNSPYSYMNSDLKDKILIITTTNGTSAIKAAEPAGDVLIASFLNAGAVVKSLESVEKLTLICSGTNGEYTIEDGLCAGYLIDRLKRMTEIKLTDLAHTVHAFYLMSRTDMRKAASVAKHFKVLEQKGFERDLEYCFKTGMSNIVPVYRNGIITK